MGGTVLIAAVKYVCVSRGRVSVGVGVIGWVGGCGCNCVGEGVCGWYSLNCCCKVCMCVRGGGGIWVWVRLCGWVGVIV